MLVREHPGELHVCKGAAIAAFNYLLRYLICAGYALRSLEKSVTSTEFGTHRV